MASAGVSQSDSIALNIMPMLDVFSILILFLLMNFSTDPMTYDVDKAVELPESILLESLDDIPTVTISKVQLRINDKNITDLKNNKVPDAMKAQGAIQPLFEELERMADMGQRFTKDDTKANVLTLEVDKEQKFELIKQVMLSAQQAGFVRFKLMVSKQI